MQTIKRTLFSGSHFLFLKKPRKDLQDTSYCYSTQLETQDPDASLKKQQLQKPFNMKCICPAFRTPTLEVEPGLSPID